MYLSLSHCTHCAGCARSSTTWCAAGRARTTSSSRIYTIGRNNLKQDNYSSPSQDIHILQVVINLKAGKLLVVPFPQPAFFSPLMQGHSLAYLPCYKDSSMCTHLLSSPRDRLPSILKVLRCTSVKYRMAIFQQPWQPNQNREEF